MSDVVEQDLLRAANRRQRYGTYSGLVEDIDDPKKLGRVKVRVWAIHGGKQNVSTDALPWAGFSEPLGGGFDYGSFNVPPVGSSVHVFFEQGIEDYPIVFGTFRGIPVRNADNPNIMLNQDGANPRENPWSPPDGVSETPGDVYGEQADVNPHPTVRVPFKSPSGHTLMMDDAPGREKIRMVARDGSGFEFSAPLHQDANYGRACNGGNMAQRGTRTVFRGDHLPQKAMKRKKSHVKMASGGAQIRLNNKQAVEDITLVVRNETWTKRQKIAMINGGPDEGIHLRNSQGSQLALTSSGNINFALEDPTGNSIVGLAVGSLVLSTPTTLKFNANRQESEIAGDSVENLVGSKIVKSQGNVQLVSSSDFSISSMSDMTMTVGRGFNLNVANSQIPSDIFQPIPEPMLTPINIVAMNGGVRIRAAGALTPPVPLPPTSAQVTLDGFFVKIGSNLPVLPIAPFGIPGGTQPMVCGADLDILFTMLTTWLSTHTHPTPAGPSLPPTDPATPLGLSVKSTFSTVGYIDKIYVPSVI